MQTQETARFGTMMTKAAGLKRWIATELDCIVVRPMS